jgi:hypothetical protein
VGTRDKGKTKTTHTDAVAKERKYFKYGWSIPHKVCSVKVGLPWAISAWDKQCVDL